MIKSILKKLAGGDSTSHIASPPQPPEASAAKVDPAPEPVSTGLPPVKLPRRVIEAPVKFVGGPSAEVSQPGVRILAQVTPKGDECRLTVEREVLPGLSWHFDRAPAAEESPLVAALFSADADVESVLLDGPRVVITRKAIYYRDW
ncbi:MAG: hypothetical protein AB7F75_07380 [Planctomycetota bacterium]